MSVSHMIRRRAGALAHSVPCLLIMVLLVLSVPRHASAAGTIATQTDRSPCEQLTGGHFEDDDGQAIITASSTVSSGSQPVCAVHGVISPSIHFEMRLPLTRWNGRYFQTGCGGYCGSVPIATCGGQLSEGYAVAAQDMGHTGELLKDPVWGSDLALRRDFSWRSTHVVAVLAKKIVKRFYGRPAAYSYFEGCSTGGREGLSEAQRFPSDFDGVITGDPAFNGRLGGIANVWDAQHLFNAGGISVFRPASLGLLHAAVLSACDGLDGLKDGIISDPRRCHFDVGRLACRSGVVDGCLTSREIAAAKAVYDGPRDTRGRRLVPGHGLFGSEIQWASTKPIGLADGGVRYLDFWPNPPADFSYRDFDFDRDIPRIQAQVEFLDPVAPYAAPDLDAFRKRGGRLLLYQGWADPGVSALMILDYRSQVIHREHNRSVDGWLRLFMVPGMFHCRGGDAPNHFDPLPALVAWVEDGKPPDRIVATQTQGDHVVRSRPLVPYPVEARYTGVGDPNDAQNWHAVRPIHDPDDRIDWIWAPRN